jgi:hypothetical protein
MISKRQARVALVIVVATAYTVANAQFSTSTPSLVQETQARGYWIGSANGLVWAAKDNGKRVSWHKATKYCWNLRLGGNSDWRLATIDELEGLVNLRAYATEHVGSSDILHWNGDLLVNGGLQLTGDRQWSSSPLIDVDGRPDKAHYWYFDFRTGRREKGFEDIAEGDTAYSLCVRDSGVVRSTSSSPSAQSTAQSPSENEKRMQEIQSSVDWTDPVSGLTWAGSDNGRDVNLGEAMKYCRELRQEQFSDWRLPTIEELEVLRRPNYVTTGSAKQQDGPFATYHLPEEISLTGDPWTSSPASEARGYFAVEWYMSSRSKTRLFDEPSYSHAKRALCVRNSVAQRAPKIDNASASAGSSPVDQGAAQETQQRGYWIDPLTKLMWAGSDNSHTFIIYSEATSYCHDLRLAHYSDWKLATIDQLQGIYDQNTESPGENPRSHDHDPEPVFFHVKGNLFLTGAEWESASLVNGENPPGNEMFFDFQNGNAVKDEHHSIRERRALCVRPSSE